MILYSMMNIFFILYWTKYFFRSYIITRQSRTRIWILILWVVVWHKCKCLETAEGFNWQIQYRSCKHYILPLCVYSTKVSSFTNWAFTGDGKKTFSYSLKHCYIKYAIFKRDHFFLVPNEAGTYMCVSLDHSCRSTAYFWFLFEL